MNFLKKATFTLKNSLYSEGVGVKTSEQMSAAISLWESLYRDNSKLSLASAIAAETARLTTLELKSKVSGSCRADFLDKQYQNLLSDVRNITELACATGGVVLKPYVSNGEIKVATIKAENFIPTEFNESGDIVGAAFLERYYSGKKVYTRVEQHSQKNGEYIIRSTAYVGEDEKELGKQISLSDTIWKDITPLVSMSGITKPLFSYFKMPMTNCIDSSSPLGISVFARATGLIADCEEQYRRLLWEFESGERALYVDQSAMRRDDTGNCVVPDRRLYRLLNSGDDTLFADWSPTFREESILNGLNEILRRIEFNSALAYGTLSDVQNVDRTAEEIKVSKQRSYAHICEIQKSLRTALVNLLSAMDALCDLYGLEKGGEYNVSFSFDDGVVAEKREEFDERLKLLEFGVIEPWEIRVWYLGEDENTAKEKLLGKTVPGGEEEA
ncbi:MAG: phage capsid protein [Clostridia bacterium]|nr:phage capsid protein [Clostridia bacterium]